MGAMLGPALEYLVTERAAPAVKIQAARTMSQLADELRTKGQSARALTLAQELRTLGQPVPATARAGQAVASHEVMQPMQPVASHSWFDTVRDTTRDLIREGETTLERNRLRGSRRGEDIDLSQR